MCQGLLELLVHLRREVPSHLGLVVDHVPGLLAQLWLDLRKPGIGVVGEIVDLDRGGILDPDFLDSLLLEVRQQGVIEPVVFLQLFQDAAGILRVQKYLKIWDSVDICSGLNRLDSLLVDQNTLLEEQ